MANFLKAGIDGTMASTHPRGSVSRFHRRSIVPKNAVLATRKPAATSGPMVALTAGHAVGGSRVAFQRSSVAGAGTGVAGTRTATASAGTDVAEGGSGIDYTGTGVAVAGTGIGILGTGVDFGRTGVDFAGNRTSRGGKVTESCHPAPYLAETRISAERRRTPRSGDVPVAGSSRGVPAAKRAAKPRPHPPIPARGEDAAPTSGDEDVAATAFSAPILNQTKPNQHHD